MHVVSQTSDDNEIINMTAIAVIEAQLAEGEGARARTAPVMVEGRV